jgi:glycosyltransferase involved in cell wall biosynthesis
MRKVIFLIKDDLDYLATNVLDLADILLESGCQSEVFKPYGGQSFLFHSWRKFKWRGYIPLFSGKLGNIEYWLRVLSSGIKADVLICVNSQGFIPGWIYKKMNPNSIFAHYCTELLSTHDRPASFSVRLMEKLLQDVDCHIDVEEYRAHWRQQYFKLERMPFVITNSPRLSASVPIKNKRLDQNNSAVFLYQGGLTEIHGLQYLLDAFALTRKNNWLFLCVYGTPERFHWLKGLVKRNPKAAKIRIGGPVPHHLLSQITARADIGMCFYPHRLFPGRTMLWCAPSKLFDYMAAGLPVICSDNPSLKRYVVEEQWGVCVNPEDISAVAAAMDNLAGEREIFQRYRHRALELFRDKYCLEKQAGPFINYLKGLCPPE